MHKLKAEIKIIGINPYVLLPEMVLAKIFFSAGKDKGPIPVRVKIKKHFFIQTLVKYSGAWRLYMNRPMLKATKKKVGDPVTIHIEYDSVERIIPMHPKLASALKKYRTAKNIFESLSPSRQKEIMRYINTLKTESAVDKNVVRAIQFLQGNEKFVGRKHPIQNSSR